jgi:hypothetical protein
MGLVQARTALEQVIIAEDVGKAITRWGVVLVLG